MTSAYQNQSAVVEWDALMSKTFMSVMRNVYLWMFLGLFVTGTVSVVLIYTPLFSILVQILQVPFLFFGILIGELILVGWLSSQIGKLSLRASRTGFIVYAILNGITMSVIFLAYLESSIAMTFITTACVFGAMGIIGYTTKIDLSKWGSYLLMGLIGFLIGSVINLFFAYSVLELLLTYAGIALFVGLTVYDTQRIKHMVIEASQSNDEAIVQRVGLLGALRLYLDFINMFLLILRLFGKGRKR